MRTINLYRYDYGTVRSVSPTRRTETDVPYCYRLVADVDMVLTDGNVIAYVIDTHTPDEWIEIDDNVACENTM